MSSARRNASASTPTASDGHRSLPGVYFRMMLIGFFEDIDGDRGIAWRAVHSLSLQQFLDMKWMSRRRIMRRFSRTRRLLDTETHQQVFDWVLQQVAAAIDQGQDHRRGLLGALGILGKRDYCR